MSSPVPVRFPDELEARVARRARAVGVPKSKVVVTAVNEWLLMQEHPLITFTTTVTGERRARLINGQEIWVIAEAWAQQPKHERNVRDFSELFEMTPEQVEAALNYWADRREEIDSLVDRQHEAQRIEYEAWERRRALEAI